MDKKILGTIIAVFALLVIGAVDVNAAACTPSSCTPTCTWTFPPSDNYDLVANTEDGNTTMVVTADEGTTSDFENITQFTISPYHNATTVQNTSQFGNTVIYSDLDDGTYKLDAIIFYDNISNASGPYIDQNLTLTQAVCSSRYFTVDTTEGSTLPLIAAEAVKEEAVISLAVIAIIAVAGWVILKKK